MKTNAISNTDNIIDSRDVIKRLAELEDERQGLAEVAEEANEAVEDAREKRGDELPESDQTPEYIAADVALESAIDAKNAADAALSDWDDSDEGAELKALKALADECEGYGDWRHGESLIHADHFREYAEELARDCGLVNDDTSKWPLNCIDWDEAAEELKADYMEVNFDGQTYYMRA